VTLTVIGAAPSLDGDFNADGSVNAADYAWIRKLGNTPQNELLWRTHFAESNPGASLSAGVPEPNAGAFALVGVCGFAYASLRNRHGRHSGRSVRNVDTASIVVLPVNRGTMRPF
jgi:hypothetical protein